MSNKVKQFASECHINLKLLEELTQWANLAEQYIGIINWQYAKICMSQIDLSSFGITALSGEYEFII